MTSDRLEAHDSEPRPAAPAPLGQLLYERHDSSILFSADKLRALVGARDDARPASAPPAGDGAGDTVVPIALAAPPLWQAPWLWRSLALTCAALVVLFLAALDLLICLR